MVSKKNSRGNKTLLTIGIPTYNRSDHCLARLADLERLGYMSSPRIEVIVHDNDSDDKAHCQRIRELQKIFHNLRLIESKPNVGMVGGCEKILAQARGKWIAILGDDDPILMDLGQMQKSLQSKEKYDHIFFNNLEHNAGKISRLRWFPKIRKGKWDTRKLCAQSGLTTIFAFLGNHCFRNRPDMKKIWLNSHDSCMFYGHCLMLLNYFKSSWNTGMPLAAWNSGNERISYQHNLLRLLELRQFLLPPYTKNIKSFLQEKPKEVVEQGTFLLKNHIDHPAIKTITELSRLKKRESITIKKIETIKFNAADAIQIFPSKHKPLEKNCCVFRKGPFKKSVNTSIYFKCGPQARLLDIIKIIAFLKLNGPIYLKSKKSSFARLYLASARIRKISGLKVILIYLFSVLFFGPANFNSDTIFLNALSRPRKGLYKIILGIEKLLRIALQRVLTKKRYYYVKELLFGRKHFRRSFRRLENFP